MYGAHPSFSPLGFERNLQRGVERAKLVLEKSKVPVTVSGTSHAYNDKFLLVEHAVNNGLQALLTSLRALGLDNASIRNAQELVSNGKAVSLRLQASRKCNFIKTEETKEDVGFEHSTTFLGVKTTSKASKTVIKHKWKLQHSFRIIMFQGAGPEQNASVVLVERTGSCEVTTTGKEKIPPEPETHLFPELSVNITELFAHANKETNFTFAIDRTNSSCHTPRRNQNVDVLLDALINVSRWCTDVQHHLEQLFAYVDNLNTSSFNDASDIFVPVLPVMQTNDGGASGNVLDSDTETVFQNEHKADIDKWLNNIRSLLPLPDGGESAGLITTLEASVCKLMLHMYDICMTVSRSCDYVEQLLRKQLIDAIGKEVTPDQMDEYMQFHYRRLFSRNVFRPFSYDVKRHGFAPEGSLSIALPNKVDGGEIATCVQVRRPNDEEYPSVPMHFKMGTSTTVELQGPQFCHGYMTHRFSDSSNSEVNLIARTRQFSSFVVMIGTIVAKDEFAPKHAIVLQNKDCAIIPLLLEPLPSAKEFRDSIESLSPEQQEFAKAMRQMQLAGTLFAVAVVEIKPQLELLLKLDPGSLTKQIELTQNLMKLFIDYQIPCDMVTFDGAADASSGDKIAAVKGHVEALLNMMSESRQKKVEEEVDRCNDDLLTFSQSIMDDCDKRSDSGMETFAMASGRNNNRRYKAKRSVTRNFAPESARMMSAPAPMPVARANSSAIVRSMQQQTQSAPSRPQQQQQQQQQNDIPNEPGAMDLSGGFEQGNAESTNIDYTQLPSLMDAKFEALDTKAQLRPTKIKVGDTVTLESYDSPWMTRSKSTVRLSADDLRDKKNMAMDLLDAISRSGELPLIQTQLHIVIASTHCFDSTILDTLIKENVNPIARVEHSSLLIATSITGESVSDLLAVSHQQRLKDTSPALFE
mmetsp:Transcript_3485/g.6127  ORF Transcript_3485/g.6127 Transcript_3485/m.6127 type:complete len:922 (+) Transcript_3485:251-3016(+)